MIASETWKNEFNDVQHDCLMHTPSQMMAMDYPISLQMLLGHPQILEMFTLKKQKYTWFRKALFFLMYLWGFDTHG